MGYTNTWDNASPPDTQPAKLLGQDIRNLKTDIQERFANFYCDVLANRPTPEAGFVGLMFFATDTGAVYRWSGTTWQPFSKRFISGGTKLIAGSFAFNGDWGGAPTVLSVDGIDAGGLITFATPAGAPATPNPSVHLTFIDGSWPATPIVVVSSVEGFPSDPGYWITQNNHPDSVDFVLAGGSGLAMPSSTYGFSFLCVGQL